MTRRGRLVEMLVMEPNRLGTCRDAAGSSGTSASPKQYHPSASNALAVASALRQ